MSLFFFKRKFIEIAHKLELNQANRLIFFSECDEQKYRFKIDFEIIFRNNIEKFSVIKITISDLHVY